MSTSSGTSPRNKSAISGLSRASISVKLPSTNVDQDLARESPVRIRSLSPGRDTANDVGRYGSLSRAGATPGGRGFMSGLQRAYSPHSSGTIPPQGTPTHPMLSDKEVENILAARIIERAWLSYRDRQMFILLKHAICAAEHSLSHEILRKVSPQESNLLKDKCMQAKIRFRFAGEEFPPLIYFKVYTCNRNGFGVKYVSGKKMITPASEAARDSLDLMGHRRFYEQLLQDMMKHQEHGVTDQVDVTTLKDYMQYSTLLDETPSYMGGRDNSWRKLTLEILPRHTIFYDVIGYLYHHKVSPALRAELPALLTQPNTEELQLEHIRILSKIRPPDIPLLTPKLRTPKANPTSRRSRQARTRASKMRQRYEEHKQDGAAPADDPSTAPRSMAQYLDHADADVDPLEDEDHWEDEADKLYHWTQQLCLEELVGTPRLGTAVGISGPGGLGGSRMGSVLY